MKILITGGAGLIGKTYKMLLKKAGYMRYLFVALLFTLNACMSIPDGIEPIQSFEINRYLGKWYEIARLDHSFERGLQHVSADYSLRQDGGIKVINRGLDVNTNKWKETEGKAYFVEDSQTAHLKVSFFGPFYGSYIIFDLGKNYEYSLVTSSNRSYFWLLSRTSVIDDALKNDIINTITDLGFDTQSLIFVTQENNSAEDSKHGD